jgi:hypothetical protein
MNVEVIADPPGNLLWASPAVPGSVRDINARFQGVMDALTKAGVAGDGTAQGMRAAGEARIVTISSGAYRKTPFDIEDPHFEKRPYPVVGLWPVQDSRFSVRRRRPPPINRRRNHRELDECRIRQHESSAPPRRRCPARGWDHDGRRTTRHPHFTTSAQGAATSILLAASSLVSGVTGVYFEDNHQAQVVQGTENEIGGVAAHAPDQQSADRLWELADAAIRWPPVASARHAVFPGR